ncbi:MAG TPA: imidazole glycerol phosphate synthase subunit HisH [Oceanithermus profundus]|uniref:Imidazole glycerol phosphate synthase subunit HisH n=1 Tax=Oceanithermus profundus TaxID=187137 RepID=A0A7C4V4L5_9DEIN|nr:imidazole glycerol phosphate synthase subunit HisH [Oceanithermus profundus]
MNALVIDYGSGNVRSVAKALEVSGFTVRVSADPDEAGRVELLVLPGQGHFAQVAANFRASGFEQAVREHLAAGRPFLGICVGLQLLYEGSEEAPGVPGLGLVPGTVRRFRARKVPQMGWNTVEIATGPFAAFHGRHFYFVHSYYAPLGEHTAGVSRYEGTAFTSLLVREHVVAPQFHPEKSSRAGLAFLQAVRAYFEGTTASRSSGLTR